MGSAGRGQGDSYLGTVLKKWFELYNDMGGSLSKGKDTGDQGKSRTRQHCFGDTNARAPTQWVMENKMSAILTRRKRHPRPFYQAELTNAENVLGCCINPFIPQWLCLHWNPEVLTQAKLPVDLVLKALIRKYAQWLQWELCLNNYSGYGP